jgi:lipopolysaccharide export system protein LptA
MWRKRLRLGIAIFGLVVAAVVLYALRPREVRTGVAPIEGLDPAAKVETRGGEAIQLSGSRQNLRIEFAGQATYGDGQTKLTDVKLMVDNRSGRNFVVTGDEARVGANNSTYDISGDVKLEASDGLTATAGSASYTDTEGIVRVPGPVQFARGRMAGAGIGFTYDEQRNTVWLLDQAVVRFAGGDDEGPMDVAAGTAGFARGVGDRYMRFERGVRMNRSGQIIEADEATVFLFADRDEPDRIELRGNASVTGGTGLGALRAMRARDINLDYAEDGRTLQQATLAGQSAIQMANQDGSDGQRLSGEFTDIALASDGAITSLTSRENVSVTLPAAGNSPPRTIRAAELRGTGQPGQGLTGMHFKDGVVFSESAVGDRPARTARARALTTRLAGGSGLLEEAHFAGSFRFEEDPLSAESAEAVYQIEAGTLALTGREGTTMPNLNDASLRIDAETIDLTLSPRRMAASGTVKSTLQPTKGKGGSAGAARRPGLLGDAEPVIIVSDKMTYDELARRGVYTGQARLLQGETQIFSDTITLDESKGDLSAAGKVRTTLALAQEKPDAKPGSVDPTIVVASTFSYADDTRRAVYDTTAPDTQARMLGEQGDLRANHIELALAKGENALDQLKATGQVTAIIGVRTAKGAELTYRPTDERYVMVGAPVTYEDECNSSAGKTLTFYKTSDRVTIDGNEEVRTETRGGKCPGTPPQ